MVNSDIDLTRKVSVHRNGSTLLRCEIQSKPFQFSLEERSEEPYAPLLTESHGLRRLIFQMFRFMCIREL